MAQNLFEKYGIKEVADVTLYRIDRKEETFESQRKISISSVLKGALTKATVYPLDAEGKGEADGFDAYVFKDADILTHYNYDCDDVITVKGSALFIDNENPTIAGDDPIAAGAVSDAIKTAIANYLNDDTDNDGLINLFDADNVAILSLVDANSGRNLRNKIDNLFVNGYTVNGSATVGSVMSKGATKEENGYINTTEVVTFKSDFICPVEMDGVTKADLTTYVGANGSLTWDGDTLTSGYITYIVPANATPEEIMGRFQVVQEGLYESVGIIVRLTQPVRTGGSTETTFTGTITAAITTENGSGTVTLTFTDVAIDSAALALINAAKQGTLTTDQLASLIALATSTAYDPSALSTETVTAVGTVTVNEDFGYNTFSVTFTATIQSSDELGTGRYDLGVGQDVGHYAMDPDKAVGTHEFSYAEQVCMLFAKNQNLITKSGARYAFANPDQLFGSFEFNDEFTTTPGGKEKAVVVGIAGKITENLYDFEEINEAIKQLTDTIEAKAYDVVYTDYVELLVEDEMGYYLPQQLGYYLDKKAQVVSFFNDTVTYSAWSKTKRGTDLGIGSAINTWGDDEHYSINDAIDALKQEQKLVDNGGETTDVGFTRVFGGYKVTGASAQSATPLDDVGLGLQYEDYTLNGQPLNNIITGNKLSSLYNLDSVIEALSVADTEGNVGEIRITSTAQMESNRAIYVNPDSGVITSRANIYLLKNINVRALASDKKGIFEFYDKNGNKLYYQDKVFAGTAYLALVTIGAYGLVFVANRNCTKNTKQVAWMINDNGYLTNKQAERIVKNGLIHTVSITAGNETFDATCTVGSIKVRKTKKNVYTYAPVLFLDTLKVSTLSQTGESTEARGGKGNAKLIKWDYGKEITLNIEDALFSPASMAAIWAGEDGDLVNGVKEAHKIEDMQKFAADKAFIIPAGNQNGIPSAAENVEATVYFDPDTMKPYQDGTPIAAGEVVLKWTRTISYGGNSLGNVIEVSAEKFPGTYRVVGSTYIRDKKTNKDQKFQFEIPQAKMSAEDTSITLEADGDPTVFSFNMEVLRPDDGVMLRFYQFDEVDNVEQGDGSKMVKDTENINLLDEAEMFKVSGDEEDEEFVIGATEY